MSGGVSLLVEGGGMRGFYSGGILRRLLDEDIRFDYVIGISSGALCACAYVAGRLEPDFSLLALGGPLSFLNPRGFVAPREGILRTGPLIDCLVGDALPEALGSPTRLLVPATSADTGLLAWWDQSSCATPEDLRARIVASASIPFVMPLAQVDGHVYADGGIRDSIPVDRAIEDGFERHVMILSRPRGYRKGPQHLELYLRHVLHPYPRLKSAMLARHVHYNESVALAEALEDAGSAFVLRPGQTNLGRFEYAPEKFEADFRAGYVACGDHLDELRRFLGA